MFSLLGILVGTLIACHPEWFLSEAEKVYSVDEAIGSSFWSLSACADWVGIAYIFELIVRGSNECLRWDLAVHHSATIAIIGMLRNAFAYEYAPQFYASIAACLLLHVVTDVPVLFIFALRGVSDKTCFKRSLFAAAWIKLAMHTAINICFLPSFRLRRQQFSPGDSKLRFLAEDGLQQGSSSCNRCNATVRLGRSAPCRSSSIAVHPLPYAVVDDVGAPAHEPPRSG